METTEATFRDWFLFMMSYPRTQPLTNTQKFTQWSAFVTYCLGGGSLLLCPQLWKFLLLLRFEGRTEGYLRLVGLGVFIIGFIGVISARSSNQVPKHGVILGSIPSRLIGVNGILLMLVLRENIPLSFALVFMLIDTLLPLITLLLWCRETEGSSSGISCRNIFADMAVILSIGVFQLFFWLVFVIRPDIASDILQLDEFQAHSAGFLACAFFTLSIHGWYHITNACAVNRPFVPTALFYRVFINVPVLVILVSVDQIEQNLFLALMSLDICISIIILLFMTFCRNPTASYKEVSEETLLTYEDGH
ncbi:uncharacterized protein LOC111328601 [Stylophora pistillata]|uniref:uncharacterized protein LOC111328601 n=1 Tax=Stylophora pistillata TaxID=50429 RepID=UPI000C04673D|nr:uncharacterized protein LOC111328601 [Stylophora pistillata]